MVWSQAGLGAKMGERRSKVLRVSLTVALGALLAVAGLAIHFTDSAQSPFIQLVYIPILCAAFLFELPGALLAAAAAGLVMSPLVTFSSANVSSGLDWLYRAGLFLGFGFIAGSLRRISRRRTEFALERAEKLTDTYTGVLRSLAQIVEGRDERARGHCGRVAENTVTLGRQLNFSEAQLETLYWGALLHDLGKIAVPEKILLKPSTLTEAEFAEIKHHPDYGADLLNAMSPEFEEIAGVVRHHHERWDGEGYPCRLSGEDIPLMSRMVTIMDVFEALTSERPYRQPMPAAQAIDYIKAEAGNQFDPGLVEAFEYLYQQGELRVASELAPKPVSRPRVDVRVTRSEYSLN